MPSSAAVRERFDAVVAEMKRLGVWDVERPTDEAFENMGAFGTRSMAFEQWLRWVFVERVQALLESDGPWPRESHVATQAYREFDGRGDAGTLLERLAELDQLFGND